MSWLGDSAALAILSFDVDAESPILVEGRRYADDSTLMSHQAYGPQVAVPRILGLLEEYSLPATFFVPGYTADHYPESSSGSPPPVTRSRTTATAITARCGWTKRGACRPRARPPGTRTVGVKPEGYRTPSWEPSRARSTCWPSTASPTTRA